MKDTGKRLQAEDSDSSVAIKVEHVSKTFRLPHNRQNSLKGSFINLFRGGDRTFEKQEVLKNVSFEIKKGEFFGIVGRNGSGKSTLLKMLAGIYKPTKGMITVNGSLTPFIELGVGFNPELTGRENVYLNGALLGFSRPEIDAMYDDIVAFSEIERFMDQRLKNYSSGMQVRLAFSIAIRARSDILVLDEVLAVGDEAFQRKCFSYFDRLKREKRTVILVTHDMSTVERFCTKAMFIEEGKILLEGKPHLVAAAYSRSNDKTDESTSYQSPKQQYPFDIWVRDSAGKETKSFAYGNKMVVELSWKKPDVRHIGLAIFRANGEYVFGPNTYQDSYSLKDSNKATYTVDLNLNEGEYFLKAATMGENDNNIIEFIEEGPHFKVTRDYDSGRWGGVTKLDHEWL